MATKKIDARALIHTPAELAAEYVAFAESIQATPGIPWGIPTLDRYVVPMRPGNLVVFTSRPGHGKTSMLAYLAKAEAKRIQARGAGDHECVVYVTWEQSAEELEAFFQTNADYSISDLMWGRADLNIIRRQSVKRAGLPLWVIGHGIGRAAQKVPRMFPETVLDAIESMNDDFGVRPTLICWDYIQLIPIIDAHDRVTQVTEAAPRVKEVGLRIGAVSVVGAQAKQEVDKYDEKIPGPGDVLWASAIHQAADKHFALMRPALYYPIGKKITIEGQPPIEVTEELFIIRMHKQRMDRGRFTWFLHFEPAYLKLEEMDLRRKTLEAY